MLGKPLIIRALESLQKHGYHQIVIVVSPRDFEGQGLKQMVENADLELEITFVLQPVAKGMGDAVLTARPHLEGRFVVTSGYHVNLGDLADQLVEVGEENVVCSTLTDEPWDYGMLKIENGLATAIVEKPKKGKEPSNQKVQTIYALNQDFLNVLTKVPESQYNFETALDLLMKKQPVGVLQLEQSVPSLKYAWHLFDFQTQLFAMMKSETDPSAEIAKTAVIDDSAGPVIIAAGVKIGHAAKVVGPCYLGENVLVGDFSFVRHSSIEAGTVIGANTEVARSIIMSQTHVHWSYISDSIIGSGVNIGAGFVTANKRLDRKNITVSVKGHKIDVGRNNFGVMIGDRAQIGIRAATMPGVCIGAEANVFPGVIVYRNLDHQQTVRE